MSQFHTNLLNKKVKLKIGGKEYLQGSICFVGIDKDDMEPYIYFIDQNNNFRTAFLDDPDLTYLSPEEARQIRS